MYKIHENYSLKGHNTFGLNVKTRYFAECQSVQDVVDFLKKNLFADVKRMVIGEGSNFLFTGNYNGIIIHPNIKGREKLDEDENYVLIKAGAGENWDQFVEWVVNQKLGNLENLSGIPGSIGASPIQNIGAYGMEVKDTIQTVETVRISDGEKRLFSNRECRFDYRNSIFKNELKNKYIITGVIYKLSKNPVLDTDYGTVETEMAQYEHRDLSTLREVIIKIRQQKLPDPKDIGNAGSFFKNPVIENTLFKRIYQRYPSVPFYPAPEGCKKIPAAWLIDHCGWKGVRAGNTGTYQHQPLILLNYGKATGKEILDLSEKIAGDVYQKFGILLEREVNVI